MTRHRSPLRWGVSSWWWRFGWCVSAVGCLWLARRILSSAVRPTMTGGDLMAQIPGVHVETLHKPTAYSLEQIELACKVAFHMNRGKLILCDTPAEDE
jgi:hypothetical protein